MSRVVPALFLGAALLSGGCIDIAKEFSDFTDRTNQIDMAVEMPDAGPSMIHDITGQFLLTLSVVVSPDQPILFLVDTTLTKQDDGTARLDTSMQPLNVLTKMPVGMPLVQTGTVVMNDGTFALHQPGDVGGDANPI